MILQQLSELELQSLQRGIPIIGREKGEWLLKQVKKLKPASILELGTANGYSGCILGSEGAELTTIEIDENIIEEAAVNFSKFNIKAKIILGDGVKVIRDLVKQKEKYDLIFLDFFKKGYFLVLKDVLKLLNSSGVIIADNITMEGCQDFRTAILQHPLLNTKLIDIRDGLSYSIRRR